MAIHDRRTWFALADAGPVARLASDHRGERRLHIVEDRAVFASALREGRPTIVILAAPPATTDEESVAIAERRRRQSLRIVHVSAPRDIERRLDALRRGFDEAVASDISIDELRTRLEILESQALARRRATIPVADDTVLDPVAHEVRRDGRMIHLRPKEYELLAMLAAHPGRAWTRRQLLDRVWGPGHEGDPRTIDVHVRWLRSKIEPTPASPVHLVTVRGVGYRLDPQPR